MTLPWDGSFLGRFQGDVITKTTRVDDSLFWYIKLPKYHKVKVMAKSIKDALPAIVDELKPLFGLLRLQTHRIKLNNKLWLLIKTDNLVPRKRVKDVRNIPDYFYRDVQNIFAFREILGVASCFESRLRLQHSNRLIRKNDECYLRPTLRPVSFGEVSTKLEKDIIVLPDTVVNKWFAVKDITVVQVIHRIVGHSGNQSDINVIIMKLRSSIEKTIVRIDDSFLYMSSFIVNRLVKALVQKR